MGQLLITKYNFRDANEGLSAHVRSELARRAKRTHLAVVMGIRSGTEYLGMHSEYFGEVKEWEDQYDLIAHDKAVLTARTGLPSRDVQLLHPELLEKGDTKFWGSAIVGNIIVACSGVEPYFDEMFAWQYAYAIRASVQHDLDKLNGARRSDGVNF